MPEHSHTGCCILIAAAALFGVAVAHAAPKDVPAEHAGGKDASPAITLDQLAGTWKNAKSGANVKIEQGAVGWEVWFSTSGEARITLPEKNRPAIKIDGRNFTCSYSVTLPTPQTMKWDLTQGQPEAQCLTGVFTRLGPAPSEVKHAAPAPPEAKQPVKREPASVKPPEAKPQAEADIAPAPAPRDRPLWTPTRTAPRHAAVYRRSPGRVAMRYRRWRAPVIRREYAVSGYRPYRYFHYRYRWYVVIFPRCGCQ